MLRHTKYFTRHVKIYIFWRHTELTVDGVRSNVDGMFYDVSAKCKDRGITQNRNNRAEQIDHQIRQCRNLRTSKTVEAHLTVGFAMF